jgi:hypothetical protein
MSHNLDKAHWNLADVCERATADVKRQGYIGSLTFRTLKDAIANVEFEEKEEEINSRSLS